MIRETGVRKAQEREAPQGRGVKSSNRGCYHPQLRGRKTEIRAQAKRELESQVGRAHGRKRADGTPWERKIYCPLSSLLGPQKPVRMVAHWHSQPSRAQNRWAQVERGSGGQTEDIQPNRSTFLGPNIHTL